jgi:hypothetical protein
MEIPLAFLEEKFRATTSVGQIMGTLLRGKNYLLLVDFLIVVTLQLLSDIVAQAHLRI